MLAGKNILLIISGGIAAYKSLDLIRRIRERGALVTPVMTKAAAEFVTPLSVSALAGEKVYQDLFDLTTESDMGHIQLSRSADLIVVAPASADLMAKMANGMANDLASTLLLATDTPVLIAPAMNVRMWNHPATQRNLAQLNADGIMTVGPNPGDMACGEYGPGRMSEPLEIVDAIAAHFSPRPLAGHKVLVTSGPTHEPIDPVRYIANRSSGAQGTAIAAALRDLGADVRFVTGPADVPPPNGVHVIHVESAQDMFDAVKANLDVTCAIFAAAVADWRVQNASGSKIKKQNGALPELSFSENPDILAHVAQLASTVRPPLVIGFAAETDDVIENATAKRARKGCDWIVANDVSPETGIMGGNENQIILVTDTGADQWPRLSKDAVATKLAERITDKILGTS
jgi:phosphopantothenoylcysteine decarboxylase/phosphopantothenate--cysteine ligase